MMRERERSLQGGKQRIFHLVLLLIAGAGGRHVIVPAGRTEDVFHDGQLHVLFIFYFYQSQSVLCCCLLSPPNDGRPTEKTYFYPSSALVSVPVR